ncbi:hypothetical protein HZC34_07270 [Candidatus Saganbacteria bacterium]|nr:hypothetical protein [Candidatus Saganbacteria bacterium]
MIFAVELPRIFSRVAAKRVEARDPAKLAIGLIKRFGAVYITGEIFGAVTRDFGLCHENNSGRGKTKWLTDNLPKFDSVFGKSLFIDLEEVVHNGSTLPSIGEKIEVGLRNALAEINGCGDDIKTIAIDEFHWTVPPLEVVKLPASCAKLQMDILHALDAQRSKGKKLVFVSWLHPKDISFAPHLLRTGLADNIPIIEFECSQEVDG